MKNAVVCLLLLFCSDSHSQTLGVLTRESGHMDGYILFAPLHSKNTYLINKSGETVHTWTSSRPPNQSVYLLPSGKLLRTLSDSAGTFPKGDGKIEIIGWDSKVLWSYSPPRENYRFHHDVCALPNGNILALVCEVRSREEALAKGRDSSKLGITLWSEKIIEIRPGEKNTGEIVWEWSVWDHLVQDHDPALENYGTVSAHPELININFGASKDEDWLHFNSIAYNAGLDQILISNRNFSEIFILDHSTTKAESAGHAGGRYKKGGDLLFRWGNAMAYNSGSTEDQKLFRQHHAHWIDKGLTDEGRIMFFNNGPGRPEGEYSSVEIIEPLLNRNQYQRNQRGQFLPDTSSWIYKNETLPGFYSKNVSGAQRLPNGHTLICEGAQGRFFEVDSSGTLFWLYVNPVAQKGILREGEEVLQNAVFRCSFYPENYPGLKGRILLPGKTIERR